MPPSLLVSSSCLAVVVVGVVGVGVAGVGLGTVVVLLRCNSASRLEILSSIPRREDVKVLYII